jgi:aspartyl protease family protein
MKAVVVSVLAVGAVIALLAPRQLEEPAERAAPAAQAAHEGQLAMAATPGWSDGEMVLDRESDGHFYATVRVDGGDYRMLVDTGASMVALTGEDAQNMGLSWDPNGLAPVARGVGGTVMGVPVKLDDIAVGDFEAHDVEAVIIPDGLGVSLLGQSFLRHVPKVDIAGNSLTLSD